MGLIAPKPVFRVSNKTRLKPVSSATETSWKIEILLIASIDMIMSNEQITKVLIRLCGCTGWSAPLLFAVHQRHVFLCKGSYVTDIREVTIMFCPFNFKNYPVLCLL